MVLNRVTQLGETRFQETLAQFESFVFGRPYASVERGFWIVIYYLDRL